MSGIAVNPDTGTVPVGPTVPRVLVYTLDAAEGERIRRACAELDCEVTVALDVHVALDAAAAETQNIVFIDAAVGERRVEDVIRAAKQVNPALAVILLATPAEVEAAPTLLMMVGYEYLTKPAHADAVAAEVRLRLDQQRARRVSAALASTLEYRGLLEVLLRLAVQEVGADTASLLMPKEPGEPLHLEAALGLPDSVVDTEREPRADGIAEWVFEHGEPMILTGGFRDLPVASVATEQRISSAIVLPLIVGHRRLGVLSTARTGSHAEPFTLRQLRAMEVIGLQAAVAIHSAQTHRALLERQKWEQELEIARAVQQHLLPRDLPRLPNVMVHALNLPARQIGGDFYNAFKLSDSQLGIVIADVSGKGIPGALLMTQCMNDMRRAVEEGTNAPGVLSLLNDAVAAHSTRGMFVTLFYAVLDTQKQEVTYANAGHLPMLVVPASGEACRYVGYAEDPPLGLVPGTQFTGGRLSFERGDALVLYTDGVVEAKNARQEEFGFDRLRALFSQRRALPLSVVGFVAKSVQAFADTQPQHDDLTLVSVRVSSELDE